MKKRLFRRSRNKWNNNIYKILKKFNRTECNGLLWLMTVRSGGHLCKGQWTFNSMNLEKYFEWGIILFWKCLCAVCWEISLFYTRHGEYSHPQDVHAFVHRRKASVAKRWENMLKRKNSHIYWHMCKHESLCTLKEHE